MLAFIAAACNAVLLPSEQMDKQLAGSASDLVCCQAWQADSEAQVEAVA